MATSESHKELIRTEFTKQAATYAANASIADPARVTRLVQAVNPPPTARVLEVATGPGYVGGMSGVVYGLAGYVWMRGKYDRASGVYLDPQSIQWLLLWLVVCYSGFVGRVANMAHLSGLVIGVVWGRVAAYFASRGS